MSPYRPHHYLFVHQMLPSLIEKNPRGTMEILAGELGPTFLPNMWGLCGDLLEDPADTLSSQGLSYNISKISDQCVCAMVQFPQPERVPEGYMAAFFLWESGKHRYFTLEFGMESGEKKACTVLCEWQDGTHLNYGSGPEPKADLFLARVVEMLG